MRFTKELNIYIWGTNSLSKRLSSGLLSDFEATIYLILYHIIATIMLFGALTKYEEIGTWYFYELMLTILIIIFGTYRFYIYISSNRVSNLGTVLSFVVLSVPLTIKILLMYHVFMYAQFKLLVYMELYATEEIATLVTMAENIIVLSIFFWRMLVHAKNISNKNALPG